MDRQGLVPNVITYNTMIRASEKGELPELALEIFAALEQQGLVPDVITHSGLISTC